MGWDGSDLIERFYELGNIMITSVKKELFFSIYIHTFFFFFFSFSFYLFMAIFEAFSGVLSGRGEKKSQVYLVVFVKRKRRKGEKKKNEKSAKGKKFVSGGGHDFFLFGSFTFLFYDDIHFVVVVGRREPAVASFSREYTSI